MNIYRNLNRVTNYIDEHLEDEIDFAVLARLLGMNIYTAQRLFSALTGLTLSDYIRKRRLSNAGFDLCNPEQKVIDVAIKYQYDNATSFSRAFEKFHGIKPSQVTKQATLKNFPKITFDENLNTASALDYEIVTLPAMNLYGVYVATDNSQISQDAPKFFEETEAKYLNKCGEIQYGMITYDTLREECQRYYCLYSQPCENFEQIIIPASKWLKFRIDSREAADIQAMSQKFYCEFLPSCKYHLREMPELEHYHDGVTDFLVAIE